MPVYAPTLGFADHRPHPRTLLLVVGAHAVLLAAVMSAKMDLPIAQAPTRTIVDLIDPPTPPPPEPTPPEPRQQPRDSVIDRPAPIVPAPPLNMPSIDPAPLPLPDPGDTAIGNSVVPTPDPLPLPIPDPVRAGPRFATPADLVKPPYPSDKIRTEEEAVLRLRLSIDARGRVTAVEPVGQADRSFLAAARRHILAHWRYKPATEDGRAVASSTVISLAFQIED